MAKSDKVDINPMTKDQIADYAMQHFGKTVNRKKSRQIVIKEFKKYEKEHLGELKRSQESKVKENEKKKTDHEAVLKQKAKEISEEKTDYPVLMKDDEGAVQMHRPVPGGIALGDPPNRDNVIDGRRVTDSAPHLNKGKDNAENTKDAEKEKTE